MASDLSRLRSPAAVQAALDEYGDLGRAGFLRRYGFGKSRDYLVRNPRTGELADSKAIVGAAFGFEHPEVGPLTAADFSGGDSTVVPRLQLLGYETVKVGDDWSAEEVSHTVAAYFDMLLLEARQEKYNKSQRNALLRETLKDRSKGSVEMKHQNVSAALSVLGLPFISGYKPRGNTQLLLRQEVQKFVLAHSELVHRIVDAMEEVKTPAQKTFKAVLVEAPALELVAKPALAVKRTRLPRKVDYAARDENNRKLGRAGEQWVLEYEQQRLHRAGLAELFARVDWVADRVGDGLGYDILSFDEADQQRFIEVKTTNGSYTSSFVISRNELDFADEVGPAFHLYRVFQFRTSPRLYMLQGELAKQLHLEPMDYRASFRRLMS
ncbi:DUF3883 domain-containing protein [Variovorax sp. Root473]|uniref:DUF3883 domain-containing protein n=1 Tax=Variovorax sp. Root473 TaxID=1736541 RepID=UPI0006FAC854|nr:DUF3883 domain-containing protein [Variovorax sp. Root473]KQX90563.1 hypothetical protein ASD34_04770 [Variovorax sp. Root473]